MKKQKNMKILAIGAAVILLSISISAVALPDTIVEKKDQQTTIIIRLHAHQKTSFSDFLHKSEESVIEPSILEINISIPAHQADTLLHQLTALQQDLKQKSSNHEKQQIYEQSLELLCSYDILPENFSIDVLMQTTEEIIKEYLQKVKKTPSVFSSLTKNILNKKHDTKKPFTSPITNEVSQLDSRIDIASCFFVFTALSELSAFALMPIPLFGDEMAVSITDFPLGQLLIELFGEDLSDWVFPIGFGGILSPVELLYAPSSLIGGLAALTWPDMLIMNDFLYLGSSLIIPVAFGAMGLTILLDRGPRQVPIPLIDIGIIGSVVAAHFRYSRDLN